ncbi:bifunctional folylpolyglutamate synthase/dihydrofolate synthase [Bacterioplanes sanyensis]|nr:folylpolyglutamate synthase/dihydrofolate synthase family protein [Bacterioplanes sanyensis]
MAGTVSQWIEYLEALNPQVIDLGLERVVAVAERLHCRRPAPLTILVGGTNGKGTTSALMAALLRVQGLSVGVYSSPHLQRYNERIAVNGEYISDDDLVESLQRVEVARGDVGLTYFEFGTLSALEYFSRLSLDVCVLEIGLGGRLDAVNVADADLTIVTSIGLDHQAWLGDTLEQIAYEKCAIARPGRPFVCGQLNPPGNVQQVVGEREGQWYQRGVDFDVQLHQQSCQVEFTDTKQTYRWSLPVPHIPHHNVATALQSLALLGRLPDEATCQQVIATLKVGGRLQRIDAGHQRWFLDVAHNPQAMSHLAEVLPEVDGIVFSALEDKPVAELLQALPRHKQLLLAGLSMPRGLSVAQLQSLAADLPVTGVFASVADALAYAMQQSAQNWLVAGSFYTVEQALNWFDEQGHGAAS